MGNILKQHAVDLMVVALKRGDTRSIVLKEFERNWKISISSFERYWKIAQNQHSVAQQAIDAKLLGDEQLAALKAEKSTLMTAIEKKELLVRRVKQIEGIIIKGTTLDYVKTARGIINMNTERNLNAIEIASLSETLQRLTQELNRMEGHHAPTKVAATNSKGDDVIAPPATINIYTENSGVDDIEIKEKE